MAKKAMPETFWLGQNENQNELVNVYQTTGSESRQLLKELEIIFNEIHKAHTGNERWYQACEEITNEPR